MTTRAKEMNDLCEESGRILVEARRLDIDDDIGAFIWKRNIRGIALQKPQARNSVPAPAKIDLIRCPV